MRARRASTALLVGTARHTFPGRTLVMGVLNVTPDSFSDGGRFLDAEHAVAHGLELVAAGADLLDVGGESTRPGAVPVSAQEEADRVVPVIRALVGRVDVPISVDTYKAEVALRGLEAGARMVNDVGGLRLDPDLAGVVAAAGASLVIMHSRRTPADMQEGLDDAYDDVVADTREVLRQAVASAVSAGVAADAIAIDPGIGFGKSVAHNLALLKDLSALHDLGCPVVVGTSRKSFLGALTGRAVDDREAATVASVCAAVLMGADIVRVHDVAGAVDAARVAEAIRDVGIP